MNDLQAAARLIRSGQLVAFPTETVYGLGANALDEAAVRRIFQAKGRPSTSPVIVHVDSIEMARRVVSEWPDTADRLARCFWPGALTLVLPKLSEIPDCVTAGLSTVGVRMPAHPVALALIQASGVPVAAPSANLFTELSPTTAEHVRQSLGSRVAMILDGGPTQLGIESTVLSLAGGNAVLLRPGMVSRTEIESVIGPIRIAATPERGAHSSPGQHPKHYSPKTRVLLVERSDELPAGRGVGIWITSPLRTDAAVRMPADSKSYAAALYASLHDADAGGFDWIAIERPPLGPAWDAIHDRLRRAAAE